MPAECEWPADIHREQDCKHKICVAIVGGPTVLNAAITYENPAPTSDARESVTNEADVVADGGVLDDGKADDLEECPECAVLSDLPCWPCYQDAKVNQED
ncbi:hypothetical protein ACFQO4_02345 [Saliphagus sp. GCM10025334]